MIPGCDLSNYTGEITPKFVSCLKSLNYGHVVVRAGLENQRNKEITQQQLGALQAGGMPTSIYLWQYYSWSPEQTVIDTAALVENYPEALWWFDCEELKDIGTPPQMVNWLKRAFAETITIKDNPGIYSGSWWWDVYMAASLAFADKAWWIADYDGIANPAVYVPCGGAINPIGKQYRGSGQGVTICGIGNIDLDVFTDDLMNFYLPTPTPTPTPTPITIVDANQLGYLLTSMQKNLPNQNFLGGIRSDLDALSTALNQK